MHPLQRRSLFAIISMIESGLQQLKSILALDAQDGAPPSAPQTKSAPGHGDYMSEDEEEKFEEMLERDRQQLAAEQAKKMADFWKDDEE